MASTTRHFAHVASDLQAQYLGTYLGHAEHRGRRYELWQGGPASGLQWWGPPRDASETAQRLDGWAFGCQDQHQALAYLTLRLRRLADSRPEKRDAQPVIWEAAA